MAKKKGSPEEVCTQQERFPTGQDGLVTNTKPITHNLDYPINGGTDRQGNPMEEFEVPQPAMGHESFMYKSHTQGKKEGRD